MTETYLIEINTDHKATILEIFKAFKVRYEGIDDTDKLTQFFKKHKLSKKERQFFRDLHQSIEESHAMARGEIVQETSYEEFLEELKQIAENENRTHQTV